MWTCVKLFIVFIILTQKVQRSIGFFPQFAPFVEKLIKNKADYIVESDYEISY